MVKKLIGFVLSGLGLLAFAAGSYKGVNDTIASVIKLPPQANSLTLTIAGIVLLAIGLLFLIKTGSSSKQPAEVPIFEGKNVVGYRRMSKK